MRALRASTALIGIAGLAAALVCSVPPTDAADAADAAGSTTCQNRYGRPVQATIVGTDGDDVLQGTSGPDVIVAGDGDDMVNVITTGDPNWDLVCAGPGDDDVAGGPATVTRGGPGDDVIHAGMIQFGGDGADTLESTNSNDVLMGGDGNDSLVSGPGHDNLVGGRGDDVVDAGPGSDFISADPGDDHIGGGASDGPGSGYILECGDWLYWTRPDSHFGFDPEDIEMVALLAGTSHKRPVTVDLHAGTASSRTTGHDTFTNIESAAGSAAGDEMRGDNEGNCLWSYGGNDRVSGRAGDDSLALGKGADRVRAGAGDDALSLQTGPSHVRGGAGSDWLYWSGPTDIDLATGVVRNKAGRGSAVSVENVQEDYNRGGVIRGDAGPNTLWGGRVYGRAGDDFLSGRSMDGGGGFDTCSAGPNVRCEVREVDDAQGWPRPQMYVPWRP